MVFVCTLIQTQKKVIKPWYGRSILDGKMTLTDVFESFASGVFDDGDTIGDHLENKNK